MRQQDLRLAAIPASVKRWVVQSSTLSVVHATPPYSIGPRHPASRIAARDLCRTRTRALAIAGRVPRSSVNGHLAIESLCHLHDPPTENRSARGVRVCGSWRWSRRECRERQLVRGACDERVKRVARQTTAPW